jgi:hypothetical protein
MHANISSPPSNAYEISVGNLQWNTTPERHMIRWEDIIFMRITVRCGLKLG